MVVATITIQAVCALRCNGCGRLLGRMFLDGTQGCNEAASTHAAAALGDVTNYHLEIVCPDSRCHTLNSFAGEGWLTS